MPPVAGDKPHNEDFIVVRFEFYRGVRSNASNVGETPTVEQFITMRKL